MSTFAVVDASGNIINRIELDNQSDWTPPSGCTLVADAGYGIGGTLIGGIYTAPTAPVISMPASPPSVLSQDLMAQFTAADITTIQTAISGNANLALLWYSMLAQRDPMLTTNARFQAGWSALVTILGQPRMTAIAAALNITM